MGSKDSNNLYESQTLEGREEQRKKTSGRRIESAALSGLFARATNHQPSSPDNVGPCNVQAGLLPDCKYGKPNETSGRIRSRIIIDRSSPLPQPHESRSARLPAADPARANPQPVPGNTSESRGGGREEQGANSTQKSKVSGRKKRASLDGGGVEAGRAAVPAPHRPSPAGTLRLHGRRSVSIDPVPPCPPIWGKICLAAALISPIRSITALRVRQSCFPDLH